MRLYFFYTFTGLDVCTENQHAMTVSDYGTGTITQQTFVGSIHKTIREKRIYVIYLLLQTIQIFLNNSRICLTIFLSPTVLAYTFFSVTLFILVQNSFVPNILYSIFASTAILYLSYFNTKLRFISSASQHQSLLQVIHLGVIYA